MNMHYPHREPLVVRNHELHVIRRFFGEPEVRVRAGERLAADHVIARTDPASVAIKIPIADQLGISPAEVSKSLMRPVGSSFAAGEALARVRKGLRNLVVSAPVAGVLISLDEATGTGFLAPQSGGEISALVPGDVEFVDGRQAVSIRTVGSRLLGIVGIGAPVRGPICVLATRPDEELLATRLSGDVQGAIVVGGAWAGAAAIKRLCEIGAKALIVGGIVERELGGVFSAAIEDRLAPWRMLPGRHAMADDLVPNLALMATEGFGHLAMHPHAFALLQECDGKEAVLFPATRVVGQMFRPELIIPDVAALDNDGESTLAVYAEGAWVRCVDHAHLGKTGVVVGPPRRSHRPSGLSVDVIDIELESGARQTVPLANLEIVALAT